MANKKITEVDVVSTISDTDYLFVNQNSTLKQIKKSDIPKPTYTAEDVGALPNTTTALPNPQKLIFTGGVTAEYDGSGAVTVTIPEGSDGSGGTVRIEKESTDTSVEISANKLYTFPEMSELTITLAEITDTTVASEYHFIFQSGATATTLTLPDTINIPDSFTVEANKVYELSILENCLTYQSWDLEVTA